MGIGVPGASFSLDPHGNERELFFLRSRLLDDENHAIDGLLNVIVVSLSAVPSAPRVCTFNAIVLYFVLPGAVSDVRRGDIRKDGHRVAGHLILLP